MHIHNMVLISGVLTKAEIQSCTCPCYIEHAQKLPLSEMQPSLMHLCFMDRKSTQKICVCVLSDLCVLPDLCVYNLLEVTDKTIIRNSKSLLHTQIVKYARTNRLIHTHNATDQHEGFWDCFHASGKPHRFVRAWCIKVLVECWVIWIFIWVKRYFPRYLVLNFTEHDFVFSKYNALRMKNRTYVNSWPPVLK